MFQAATKRISVLLKRSYSTLLEAATAARTAYNPYEATFRIPQSVTKTNARACLAMVHGVQMTYIRTGILLRARARHVER